MADIADPTAAVTPYITWGADSKEIVIKYAGGFTSAHDAKALLIPGTHYINLTGAKNSKNPVFVEPGATATVAADGGEASGAQVLIKNYE